ncbi:MAG: glycoside hydrolase family 9 protein [Fibrobacter sp.]|nr:glycoside hydrolase family 9 protein [Fibrobacter sp.]
MGFKVCYNHVGYAPVSPKEFLLAAEPACVPGKGFAPAFEVVSESGSVVYTAAMSGQKVCDYTDEFIWKGDFSAVKKPGRYKVRVTDGGNVLSESHLFDVSDDIVPELLRLTLKSFYFQRSGVELPADKAGKWARPAAHLDDCIEFHPSMNREGTWNAHGGWYDAGDYGKYIVNGGVSLATLLLAAEFTEKSGNLPGDEPGSSFREDLLDEIRFELEFFLRMQDTDGGVFFKVSPIRWDGFVTPTESDESQKRQILGKSTTSTLNFAGALAQAHRVYESVDPAFAQQCLTAAIRAYAWATKNPDVTYPHNTEGSGGYGDERYDDEFFWARAMLFREVCIGVKPCSDCEKDSDCVLSLSGNLRDLLLRDMEKCPPSLGLDWRDTQNLGWIALALQSRDLDLQVRARGELKRVADEIVRLAGEDAYGLALRRFIWGSNGEIANHALTLFLVNTWSPSVAYVDSAKKMLDFVFGKNPVERCFVSGAAWSSPKFLHHRISHSDGIDEPIPGLVAGGINADRQDLHRFPHYPGPQPGLSYTDERCSFASNETAINWNAPLVTALYFECLR